jgi:hypothetical protein
VADVCAGRRVTVLTAAARSWNNSASSDSCFGERIRIAM